MAMTRRATTTTTQRGERKAVLWCVRGRMIDYLATAAAPAGAGRPLEATAGVEVHDLIGSHRFLLDRRRGSREAGRSARRG